jgi:hypothetical protein
MYLGTLPQIAQAGTEFLARLPYHVMGIHGIPGIAPSRALREVLGLDWKKHLISAREYASALPKRAQEFSMRSNISHSRPPESTVAMVVQLAHYKTHPDLNGYCYIEEPHKGRCYKGFVATPLVIDYGSPHPVIKPDREAIERIGWQACFTSRYGPQLLNRLSEEEEFYSVNDQKFN